MKRLLVACAALLGLVNAVNGQAAPLAVTEQVQSPAWLVRDGKRDALSPGQPLQPGDRIETGGSARVYLRLAEGSQIKLGEQAVFSVESGALAKGVLTGLMDVINGAFRFTTGLASKQHGKRNVSIRVSTATIGIRGTDVWGKAADQGDLVALIEGNISLSRGGQALSIQPMQYMDAPRGGAAQIRTLDEATLNRLALETELATGAGMSKTRKGWAIVVGDFVTEDEAQAPLTALRAAGYPARVMGAGVVAGDSIKPAGTYRLVLAGFANEAAATADLLRLPLPHGLSPRVVILP